MSHATVEEFQHEFGRYKALVRREPVVVMNGGHAEFVVLSADEYRRLKRLDRSVVASADLNDVELALLDAAVISPEARKFDHEY